MVVFLFELFFDRDKTVVARRDIVVAYQESRWLHVPATLDAFYPYLTIRFGFSSEFDGISAIASVRNREAILKTEKIGRYLVIDASGSALDALRSLSFVSSK